MIAHKPTPDRLQCARWQHTRLNLRMTNDLCGR
jgi:hypothetical protein